MKKYIFFLMSAAFMWASCSMEERAVQSETVSVEDGSMDRVALEALELRQMFYGSTAVKSADMGTLSITRLDVSVKSASAYIPYVVNYPDGGYAILADDGTEVVPVVLGDAGSFDPQILQDALDGVGQPVLDTTITVSPGYEEEDDFDPEDAPHGDEHIPYYPMDILPYDSGTNPNTGFTSGWQVGPDDDGPNPYLGDVADFILNPRNEPPCMDTVVTTVPGVDPQPPTPCPDSLKGKWLQMWGVKPLLKTEWHQNPPYNQFCPVIDGQHAVAGCVPIAVAQIGAYLAPPDKSWDWAGMTGSGAEADRLAAEFISYAGKEVKADYGLEKTGATDYQAKRFLKNEIGCEGLSKRRCKDFDKFYDRVTDRLKHHLPVYAGGYNSYGGGHAYVIDGFVEQKKYIDDFAMRRRSLLHVNWGWGSSYNGWFLADMLDKNKKVTDFDENDPMYRYGSTPGMYDGRAITITYRVPDWR